MNFFLSGYNNKIDINISGWRRKRFWSCLGRWTTEKYIFYVDKKSRNLSKP
jgi:hypothetical protein